MKTLTPGDRIYALLVGAMTHLGQVPGADRSDSCIALRSVLMHAAAEARAIAPNVAGSDSESAWRIFAALRAAYGDHIGSGGRDS
jgi:hypothetical protein